MKFVTSFIILEMSSRTTFVQLVCFVNSIIESEVTWRNIDQQIMVPNYSIRNSFICYQLSFVERWSRNHENTRCCPSCSVWGQFSILVAYFCRLFEKMENYSLWTPKIKKIISIYKKAQPETLEIKENKIRRRVKRWMGRVAFRKGKS